MHGETISVSLTSEKSQGGIYQIRNLQNEKKYIGSSKQLPIRWREHRAMLRKGSHHSIALQSAFRKYGEASIVFEIVELCEQEHLEIREQYWLDNFKPEYNMSLIVGRPKSRLGLKSTLEHRMRQSASLKGRKSPMKGQNHSQSTKDKISASHKMRDGSPRGSGWRHSDDTCKLISKHHSLKSNVYTPKKVESQKKVTKNWWDTATDEMKAARLTGLKTHTNSFRSK